jgi:hypothetical protein
MDVLTDHAYGNTATTPDHGPAIWLQNPGKNAQQRRFSTPVRTQQPKYLPGLQSKADAFQNSDRVRICVDSQREVFGAEQGVRITLIASATARLFIHFIPDRCS